MYVRNVFRIGSTLVIALFALLLTACASNSTAGTTSAPTTSAATATPSPTPGITFQQFTASGFTLQYPADWQKTQSKSMTAQPVYSFTAADNTTSFHVELHATYFDADTPIVDFFGASVDGQADCHPGDTSLPATISISGKTWFQNDILCPVAGAIYEIHMLANQGNPGTQMYIAYGAYQTSTTSPDFATISQEVFEPMLHSFQLT